MCGHHLALICLQRLPCGGGGGGVFACILWARKCGSVWSGQLQLVVIVLHFVLLPQLTVLTSTAGGAQEEAGTRRAGPSGSHGDTSRCEWNPIINFHLLLHMNAHYSNIGANPYVRTYIMIVCDLYIGYLYYHKSKHLDWYVDFSVLLICNVEGNLVGGAATPHQCPYPPSSSSTTIHKPTGHTAMYMTSINEAEGVLSQVIDQRVWNTRCFSSLL